MSIKKSDFLTSFANALVDSAQANAARAVMFASQYDETKDEDVKRAMQRSETHAKYDSRLSGLSIEALNVCYIFKLDAAAIVNSSRELKKRLMSALNAIATSDKNKLDKAFLSVLSHVIAHELSAVSIHDVQHQMNHETNTQANYFKRFCLQFEIAEYNKEKQLIIFKQDKAFFKKLIELFD